MDEPLMGCIVLFAGNYAPKGWAFCDGRLLSIYQNQALFSILGTNYGGDGRTTFALPDLRGRVPIQAGQGPGLSSRDLGDTGGEEWVTLEVNQLPAHSHPLNRSTSQPAGKGAGNALSNADIYAAGEPGKALAEGTVGNAGNNDPHHNMQPFLALNYIIALQGLYPQHD